jgi:hypothetical protein
MNEQTSHSLQLLAQLEAQLEHLMALEAEVTQWQVAAQHHQRQLNRLESRMHRTAMHFIVERDGLKQERDAAYAMLLQLVTILRPLLDEAGPEWDDLRIVTDAAIQMLKEIRFLDKTNLDTTLPNDSL